jgi:hypothetical protein
MYWINTVKLSLIAMPIWLIIISIAYNLTKSKRKNCE